MERLKIEECKSCRKWSGCIVNCLDTCGKPIDALKEFNTYKTLEEQGKLLKLPCAMGDIVYRICSKCNDEHNGSCENCAWEHSCTNCGCNVYGGWKDGQFPMGECTIVSYKVSWNYIPNLLENIGKKVFLTYEEAEAALKEL